MSSTSFAAPPFANPVINKSELLQALYFKLRRDSGESSSSGQRKSWELGLQEIAMKHHSLCLQRGRVDIHQWKAHSVGVDQCRMKMGLLLTGVGDKVMRLWSLDSYKCQEEYHVPDTATLVDFDFDESKIVGLLGTRVGIWGRNGKRSIFPSREGTFPKGLCLRYIDPEAVIGCQDGTARVFDMYSRTCSRIIKMHSGPVTCLALSDDQLIVSGSSLGSISISNLSSDQRVATLRSTDSAGIRTLCFNPSSHLVFAGTTVGYTYCWDLRTMKSLWGTRVSSNVVYSLNHLQSDKSTLVVGGIDGVLRVLNQNTGKVLSRCVISDERPIISSRDMHAFTEKKKGLKLLEETEVDRIPRTCRPPITCLAIGMKKVITAHNSNIKIVFVLTMQLLYYLMDIPTMCGVSTTLVGSMSVVMWLTTSPRPKSTGASMNGPANEIVPYERLTMRYPTKNTRKEMSDVPQDECFAQHLETKINSLRDPTSIQAITDGKRNEADSNAIRGWLLEAYKKDLNRQRHVPHNEVNHDPRPFQQSLLPNKCESDAQKRCNFNLWQEILKNPFLFLFRMV
ncbi:hypothetical protein V6N13_097841 [Hibiscus sabdariffa]